MGPPLIPTPSGPVCNFWSGIARKLFLPPFFIVFSVKKEQTLEQKVFTADFHIKQTRSRIFLCHKIGFKLTGKPIPIYLESTQIILTKPKNKDSKDGRKTHNFCSRAPKKFFSPNHSKKIAKKFFVVKSALSLSSTTTNRLVVRFWE